MVTGIKNLQKIGDAHYKIVRYEDMIMDTAKVAQEICTFLGIRFNQSMLVPTVNGQPAIANTAFKNMDFKAGEISQASKDLWQKELTVSEINYTTTLLANASNHYGYKLQKNSLIRFIISALKINHIYNKKPEFRNLSLKKALLDWIRLNRQC